MKKMIMRKEYLGGNIVGYNFVILMVFQDSYIAQGLGKEINKRIIFFILIVLKPHIRGGL